MKAVIDIPNQAQQQQAAATLAELRRKLKEHRKTKNVAVTLPEDIISHVTFFLETLAKGKGLELITLDEHLTTQQAADLLGVSRPFVVKLLVAHQIPFTTVGTHRRIRRSDLKEFEEKQEAIREEQLNFLAKQAQDLNMGY